MNYQEHSSLATPVEVFQSDKREAYIPPAEERINDPAELALCTSREEGKVKGFC